MDVCVDIPDWLVNTTNTIIEWGTWGAQKFFGAIMSFF
jgi:hypothetical protein